MKLSEADINLTRNKDFGNKEAESWCFGEFDVFMGQFLA